jgi:tetratricopeptide (TPR) repeat protein
LEAAQIGKRHRARASAALDAGRYALAEKEARAALAIDPRDVTSQLFLCRAYLGLASYEKAIEAARAALAVSPGDGYGHYLLGFALQVSGRSAEAVEQLREAVRLHPSAPRYYARLAIALTDIDDRPAARKAIDIALGLDAENPTLLDEASRVYGLVDALDLAEDCARKLIRIEPNDAASHWRLAWVLGIRRRHREATEHSRVALRIDPNYWPGWEELGYSLLEQGLLDEAHWALREALRLKPALTSATLNLAHLYRKQGFLDDAMDVCEMTLATAPQNARVRRVYDSIRLEREQRERERAGDRVFLVIVMVCIGFMLSSVPLPVFLVVGLAVEAMCGYLLWRSLRPAPRAPLPSGGQRL